MAKEVTLKVSEAVQEDVAKGRVRVDAATRLDLHLTVGDVVEIIGKKSTAAIVWRAHPDDEGKGLIRMDGLIRDNAGVGIGDKVRIRKVEVNPANRITLAPVIEEGQKLQFGSGIEGVVKRGLFKRPVTKGDTVIVPGIALIGRALPFIVVEISPAGIVQITEGTEVNIREEAISESELAAPKVTYEDVGGLKDELTKVREMIELPLKHPELFDRLGIEPPKGVLLQGPPGTGKTLIAKAVANESGANFYSIQGPEIMSKFYGESEARLREVFEEAEQNAPAIIFIDEIDSIASKREDTQGEVERRVVAQLLTLMDGLKGRGKVVVIGATNRVDAVDPALRRPGRFDREIEIGVPSREGRKEILQIHTRSMPLDNSFDLDYLVDNSHGFVGADLAALAKEGAMKALRRYLPDIDLDKPIPTEVLEKMHIKMDDFKDALREIEPSALREVLIEIPRTTWEDVGGLGELKQQLREAVEWPLNNPEVFKRMGIKPPRGILLYGPPGTGKTLLAKAVANESRANFISVKGPEVLSKWVGESEKAIREIFKKAKQASPCIIFMDEIDSIAPRRSMGSSDSHVTERMVNQLLTSIDGMEALEGIVVIAATNRPDILDPALLRAGRFDRLLQAPPPDQGARKKILEIHAAAMPLQDVDLEELSRRTNGYVGADLQSLCREAAMLALRVNMKADIVTMKDFEQALSQVRPSVDENTTEYYKKIAQELEGGIIRKQKEARNSQKGVEYL
ncbi:MAG: transitional endoplasmic reticulum ATPase [Thermoplasmata archaeon]|nr:transitional endoplasmic reticulum ATPase [Thermoplasmata archaeon]